MSHDFCQALGQRLRAARKFKKLTQEETAKNIGIATATLNKYERGHHVPDAEILAKIVDFLGCDAAWLLMGRSRFFTGEPLDTRYVQQGSAWVKDDSRIPEIDPAVREIVDWARASEAVRGALLLLKEERLLPFVQKHAPHLLADLERNISKAG